MLVKALTTKPTSRRSN